MIPYTYFIKWSETNKSYYGVRYAGNCDPNDLWKSYFTSSVMVREHREIYGDPDIIEVRRVFSDAAAAREWEHKVLRRLKVANSTEWLNQCDSRSLPPMLGDKNPSRSPEVREKISKALTGRKRPDVAKNNLRLKGKGIIGAKAGHRHSSATKHKIGEAQAEFAKSADGLLQRERSRQRLIGNKHRTGHVASEETRAIFRQQRQNQIMITNGTENRRVHANTSIPDSWRRGCTKRSTSQKQ